MENGCLLPPRIVLLLALLCSAVGDAGIGVGLSSCFLLGRGEWCLDSFWVRGAGALGRSLGEGCQKLDVTQGQYFLQALEGCVVADKRGMA